MNGRDRHRRGPRVALIGGTLALVVAAVLGAVSGHRVVLADNGVGPDAFVVTPAPGDVVCQDDETLPAGAGYLQMTIGTYGRPGPAVSAQVTDPGGRRLLTGRLAAGWRQGRVLVPLGARTPRMLPRARICIANQGAHRIALAGAIGKPRSAAVIGRRRAEGRLSLLYISRASRSRGSSVVQAVKQVGAGNGLWEDGAPWAALALLGLAAAGIARATW